MTNTITLMGRLVRDPELRHTQSGLPVARFTLACERDFKDASGEKQTDFIDCVAWRKTAENVSKFLTKGRMAVVSGRLQLRDWTDREGIKRRNAEILTNTVSFADSRPKTAAEPTQKGAETAPRPAAARSAFSELSDVGGELPF